MVNYFLRLLLLLLHKYECSSILNGVETHDILSIHQIQCGYYQYISGKNVEIHSSSELLIGRCRKWCFWQVNQNLVNLIACCT